MKLKKPVTLAKCPVGALFMYEGTLALKTEYRTSAGLIEAYIVGSGEFFWGGTSTVKDQAALMVQPIKKLKITESK